MQGARRLKKSEQLGPDARYELLLRLASGGMGAVFVGVQRADTRPEPGLVAIKRAHAHLIEQLEFRKMFVAEASLARRISHPNAVGVVDVDESEGELLMIMRYVEGGSLSDMLAASHERGRRIAPPVTLRVVVDASRGLEAAHALRDEHGRPLGIVHRDISPHNILVGLDGVSAIVDFGVAKAASIEATRTATDVMKGKTAYMAPEYVKSRVANAQTDVFALGIVAWEALANRRLWKGEDEMDTIRRLLEPTPAPLLHQIVDLDPTVAAVVARAVAKDPTKRFPTAQAFGDALETAARAADLLARPAEVAATVKSLLAAQLAERRTLLAEALAVRGRDVAPRSAAVTAPVPILEERPPRASHGLAADALATQRVLPRSAPPPAASLREPRTPAAAAPAGATALLPAGYPPLATPMQPAAPTGPASFHHDAAPTTTIVVEETTTTAATPTARVTARARGRSATIAGASALAVVVAATTALLVRGPAGSSPEPQAADAVSAPSARAAPPPATEDAPALDTTSAPAEPMPTAEAPPDEGPAPAAPPPVGITSSAAVEAPAAPASAQPARSAATSQAGSRPPATRPPPAPTWRPKANPY